MVRADKLAKYLNRRLMLEEGLVLVRCILLAYFFKDEKPIKTPKDQVLL